MINNDLIALCYGGVNGFVQYQQFIVDKEVIEKERKRQKRREFFGTVVSILSKSVEPTAEYYDSWFYPNPEHPTSDRVFATAKYAADMIEIAYKESEKQANSCFNMQMW